MCGLFGALTQGTLSHAELRNLRILGVLSVFRGMDSSGIAVVGRKKNDKFGVQVRRRVGDAVGLLNDNSVKELLTRDRVFLVSGHSRHATNGTVNERNAHPISEGPLVVCHNGSIREMEPPKAEEAINSDSRVLVRTINERGLEAALTKAESGAYALAYIDKARSTFNFIRNSQRPLSFMWNRGGTTLYWSSEKEMLEYMEKKGEGLFNEPISFDPHVLYTLRLGQLNWERRKLTIERPSHHYVPMQRGGAYRWDKDTQTWIERNVSNENTYPPTITPQTSMFAKAHEEINRQVVQALLPAPREREVKPYTYCTDCQRAEEYCTCDTCKLTAPTSVPTVGIAHKDPRLYRGWDNIIQAAGAVAPWLQSGCVACRAPMCPESRVHWISALKVVCNKCMQDRFVFDYVKIGRKLFPGQLLTGVQQSDARH